MVEIKEPAIIVSAYGDLQPQKIVPENTPTAVDLKGKIILTPDSKHIDLDYCLQQLKSDSTLRQLPFLPYPNASLSMNDLWNVLIEIPLCWNEDYSSQEQEK